MSRLFFIAAIVLLAPVAGAQPPRNLGPDAPQQTHQAASEGRCLFNVILVDEPGILGVGGPLTINANFPNVTAAQRAVFQQAINEWQALVLAAGTTRNPYPVTFQFADLGGPPGCMQFTIASAVTVVDGPGDLQRSTIRFNSNACVTFFVDPTPGDDVEFSPACAPPTCTPAPANSFDLLTVARHELGHALGWVGTLSRRVSSLLAGTPADASRAFNPPRLNIPTVTAGCGSQNCHTDAAWRPNDLMQPNTPPRQRRPISLYPVASLPARAFAYRVPMQFVDPTHDGTETGTAVQPWRTFPTACASSPLGTPLLFANSTHLVPAGFGCANRHVVDAARGGAVVRP